MESATSVLAPEEQQAYERDGFLLRRGQLPSDEIERLFEHFAELHARGSIPGCFTVQEGDDPLARWPRMMHPHRIDDLSLRYLLDPRLMAPVAALYGEPALAAQSMFYWKPPGARGQALHQDDFYLRTRPGDCMAAWVALDAATAENGGLRVVPGTHRGDLQCPHPADAEVSFSQHEVNLPPGAEPRMVEMGAGDILFFPGRLIHGSLPNTSNRWRRSFICHYVPVSSAECARGYQPLLDAEGRAHEVGSPGAESDPCGGPEYGVGTR